MRLKAHGLLQTISAELETMYGLLVLGILLGALVSSFEGPVLGFGLSFGFLGLVVGTVFVVNRMLALIRSRGSTDSVNETQTYSSKAHNPSALANSKALTNRGKLIIQGGACKRIVIGE